MHPLGVMYHRNVLLLDLPCFPNFTSYSLSAGGNGYTNGHHNVSLSVSSEVGRVSNPECPASCMSCFLQQMRLCVSLSMYGTCNFLMPARSAG